MGEGELQEGVSGEGSWIVCQLSQNFSTDKARPQTDFHFQLLETAEKRGFVDFVICTNDQTICCNNNRRLTQSAKNITKLYSDYIHNGIRQKPGRLVVF